MFLLNKLSFLFHGCLNYFPKPSKEMLLFLALKTYVAKKLIDYVVLVKIIIFKTVDYREGYFFAH